MEPKIITKVADLNLARFYNELGSTLVIEVGEQNSDNSYPLTGEFTSIDVKGNSHKFTNLKGNAVEAKGISFRDPTKTLNAIIIGWNVCFSFQEAQYCALTSWSGYIVEGQSEFAATWILCRPANVYGWDDQSKNSDAKYLPNWGSIIVGVDTFIQSQPEPEQIKQAMLRGVNSSSGI